jgi:hypothetical protein
VGLSLTFHRCSVFGATFLAYTWTIKTLEGKAAIAAMVASQALSVAPLATFRSPRSSTILIDLMSVGLTFQRPSVAASVI